MKNIQFKDHTECLQTPLGKVKLTCQIPSYHGHLIYKCKLDDQYVLLKYWPNSTQTIVRSFIDSWKVASNYQVGPKLLFSSIEKKLILMEALESSKINYQSLAYLPNLKLTIDLIQRIHQIRIPYHKIKSKYLTIDSVLSQLHPDIAAIKLWLSPTAFQCWQQLFHGHQQIDQITTWTHQDFYPLNFGQFNRELKAIDWDQGCVGNPMQDIAMLAQYLPHHQHERLLMLYFNNQKASKQQWLIFSQQFTLLRLLCLNWCFLQVRHRSMLLKTITPIQPLAQHHQQFLNHQFQADQQHLADLFVALKHDLITRLPLLCEQL
ncbi:aminoglycoside phosphotransferase family protein [Gammaproteobacteria bacterium]|nr:aminoglycoside phosphotransferase family protein [Gammaproteobacteria bacterium]